MLQLQNSENVDAYRILFSLYKMAEREGTHYIDCLAICSLETPERVIDKQCRPRSGAVERGVGSVSTVCKKYNHFPLGISKSHNLTYLKSKFEASNI